MNTVKITALSKVIASSKCFVAFTGAGISTESGIPDFRSPGGVWAKNRPVYFDQFMADPTARFEYWRQKSEAHRDFALSKPNIGHQVLAKWETHGRLRGIITQNIDELHQLAGNQSVLELHGTARQVACMNCGDRNPADPFVDEFLQSQRVPSCQKCGGIIKHATVSFGQALPEAVLREAESWCHNADLLFAMGSSLVVTPAADLPRIAKNRGAKLVIINRDPTPLDPLADYVIHEGIGETLTKLEDQLTAGG